MTQRNEDAEEMPMSQEDAAVVETNIVDVV